MTTPTGIHFDAKPDGKEYPVSSGTVPADAEVILKQLDAHTIEMTTAEAR